MDFKGITCGGDIYDKFETTRLEVEEVMHEDLFKLVEKKAQKLGVSAKKLYAEVVLVRDYAKHIPPMIPRVEFGYTRSKECFRKSKRAGLTRRSIGIRRISHPPKASHDCDTSICSVAFDDSDVTTTSSEYSARHDPSDSSISDATSMSSNSDQILSPESVKQEKNDKELPAEYNDDATECNSSCHSDMLRKDDSLSQINSSITETGSVGEEATASYEDNFDIEVIEPVEKSELDESCILVEGDELHSVSRGLKKHKSYNVSLSNPKLFSASSLHTRFHQMFPAAKDLRRTFIEVEVDKEARSTRLRA